jgi:phosphate transport system permease protein
MTTTYAADWPNDIEQTAPVLPVVAPMPGPVAGPPSPPTADPDVPRNIHAKNLDDHAAFAGSAVAALAFSWLVFERLLDFSGTVGFVVLTWVAFLFIYAGVTLLGNPVPILWDRLASAIARSAALLIFGLVLYVLCYVFWNGRHAIFHVNFYTHDMSGVRPTSALNQGGIEHAIVGTAIQVGLAIAMSLPLGIGTAVYLSEVGGRGSQVVRTVVEAMTALPDILAGLFVYTLLILLLHWPRDGLTVSIALSVTMIPIIARSAEVVLRVVPGGLREAGLALGASRWRTVWNVVLPTGRSGLVTSVSLGIARVAGETAPLLIVSGATIFFNYHPTHNQMNSLPLFIFAGIKSGEPRYIDRAYGAAAVLLFLVIALFVLARYVARDKSHRR